MVEKVFTLFKDYYGEDRIDLQTTVIGGFRRKCIIVYFPEVTVTNEQDASTVIKDLYVRVVINADGTLLQSFTMIRSTFRKCEIYADYAHSHLPGILTEFHTPCLGSGPINRTIASLNAEFSEELWMLFCYELDLYVKTESIEGVPYRRLSNIVPASLGGQSIYWDTPYHAVVLYPAFRESTPSNVPGGLFELVGPEFIKHILTSEKLKFTSTGHTIIPAYSYKQFVLVISNAFIEWWNNEGNAKYSYVSQGEVASQFFIAKLDAKEDWLKASFRNNTTRLLSYEGTVLLSFKGTPIKFTIEGQNEMEDPLANVENLIKLLHLEIVDWLYGNIIYLVNYYYGDRRSN